MKASLSLPFLSWPLRGVLLIASVYFYFLIFAQFAFLHLVEATLGMKELKEIMTAMGVGGLVGSFLVKPLRSRLSTRTLALIGLSGCGAAAMVAGVAQTLSLFLSVAAGVGLSLGLLTVTCAGELGVFLGSKNLGLKAGVATGLAYAASNLPLIFTASPKWQTYAATGGIIVSLLLVPPARARWPALVLAEARSIPIKLSLGVLIFFAMVWLDSAAFFVIQETPNLNHWAWEGSSRQYGNALFHFLGALLAGFWLDCGLWRVVLGISFGCLALGIACLNHTLDGFQLLAYTPWFYTAGVSFYSTALLLFPLAGHAQNQSSIVRAAWTYALAGWVASALGIGMGQNLHQIPDWFVVLSGLPLILGLTTRKEVVLPSLGLVLLVLTIHGVEGMRPVPDRIENDLKLGKQVYIEEGCLECHSQYVRPGTTDELIWGPARSVNLALDSSPPLIGNRRQGPDLQNIGNRRSIFWNRLHLETPQQISPGSIMPAYDYLFKGGGQRGEVLLLYLQSLGADTVDQRKIEADAWHPWADAVPLTHERSRQLFLTNCAVCHGPEGLGNGPLASRVGGDEGPRNLVEGKLELVIPSDRINSIARVIKFGMPGTSMAGHEYFTDADLLGLATYVDGLGVKNRKEK